MTDKELDRMLKRYCETEPDETFVFKPEPVRKSAVSLSPIRFRALVAAAGLVLVSTLSFTAYYVFSSRMNSPAVISSTQSTVSEKENSFLSGDETQPQTTPSASTQSTQTSTATESTGFPTEKPTTRNRPAQDPAYQSPQNVQPTPPASAEPTKAAGQSETEAPIQTPSEDTGEQETAPQETTYEAPTVLPTDNAELVPTAKWINYLSQQSLSGTIQKALLTGEGRVYFRLYAFDGSPLGDEDLFSQGNLAAVAEGRCGTVTASFYLGKLEDDLEKIQKGDCLTYRFFNEDGDEVCMDIKVF